MEEYCRMAEVGILQPDERVEPICGEILLMAPIGPKHVWSVNSWNRMLAQLVIEGRVIVQNSEPNFWGHDSQPEPDIALLTPETKSHPGIWLPLRIYCWQSKSPTLP